MPGFSEVNSFVQIVNWKTYLKFPEEARLSPEAKDLISKLLCNVNQRLGSKGADEIKVLYGVSFSKFLDLLYYLFGCGFYLCAAFLYRLIHSSKVLNGISSIKWKLHLFHQAASMYMTDLFPDVVPQVSL